MTPRTTKPHSLGMTLTYVTEWKFQSIYCMAFICENTKLGKKNLWNWLCKYNFMIFDLFTSPKGHQFEPRVKILPAFYSSRHSRWFDMPHGHVWKKMFLTPSASKFHPRAWPRRQNKNPFDIFHIFYLLLV